MLLVRDCRKDYRWGTLRHNARRKEVLCPKQDQTSPAVWNTIHRMQIGEERECPMSGFDLFRESKCFETTIGPKKNKVIAKQVEARAEQSDGKSEIYQCRRFRGSKRVRPLRATPAA